MKHRAIFLALGLVGLALSSARAQDVPPPPPPPDETVVTPNRPTATVPPPSTTNNHYLLLPDISFIGVQTGVFSSDKSLANRNKFLFREGELAVQSFVYPGIKQDAFIVFANDEIVVEEAYLTVQHLNAFGKFPYSLTVGRRKAPFGRVNQLHPHSWLNVDQPAVLRNLVAEESLTGDGAYVSYLFPTKFFLQLDAGVFGAANPTTTTDVRPSGGAGFSDTFSTARLWASKRVSGGELELGGSLAKGKGTTYPAGEGSFSPENTLRGADFSWRKGTSDSQRLLLRGEYIDHEQKQSAVQSKANGYYLLADKRFNTLDSLGLRYDNSGYAYQAGREKSASIIATHQLTEQTYLRFEVSHGDRPSKKGFTDFRLQWTWGVGPHTHNLE